VNDKYDALWDENCDAWDKKYEEWKERDWEGWLDENLNFPFEVKRVEDDDSAFFTDLSNEPFRLGHKFKVLSLEYEDDMYGILVNVKEGRRKGTVTLCDLEVMPKTDKNFWIVREYVVWFANQ